MRVQIIRNIFAHIILSEKNLRENGIPQSNAYFLLFHQVLHLYASEDSVFNSFGDI